MKIGILIQGSITEWTPHIINEYKENFSEAEILLSTWNNENIEDINCDLIQLEKPGKTSPHESNINFQIKGAVEGLKEMKSDTILKTKTNQFIHNRKIFEMYREKCNPEKIMTVNWNTFS